MQLGVVPDSRTRHTFIGRVRQALPADTYLEADYRRYVDSWQLDSNTVSVGLSHYFTPKVMAGFTYRWYDQTGAIEAQYERYLSTTNFVAAIFSLGLRIPF